MSATLSAEPTCSVETIGPAEAAEYLKANTRNRKVSRGAVKAYAAAISAGEWRLNGETIKFDADGTLIDGQHRLMAIVEAGAPIRAFVMRGLAPESITTIDTGKARTGGDLLSMLGYSYPNETGAAARMLHFYLRPAEAARKKRLSHDRLLAILETHGDLAPCVARAQVKPYANRLTPNTHRGFVYYMAHTYDPQLADRFFRELAGDFEKRGGRRSTVTHMLRERLIMTMAEALPPSARVVYTWLVLAWNAYVAERPAPRFSRVPGRPPRFDPSPFVEVAEEA